jgi:hypothetical protein
MVTDSLVNKWALRRNCEDTADRLLRRASVGGRRVRQFEGQEERRMPGKTGPGNVQRLRASGKAAAIATAAAGRSARDSLESQGKRVYLNRI